MWPNSPLRQVPTTPPPSLPPGILINNVSNIHQGHKEENGVGRIEILMSRGGVMVLCGNERVMKVCLKKVI